MRKPLAYLTVGAMVAVGMTGAFATSAVAEDGAIAPTEGPAFDAYAQALLGTDEVQAVATDADGNVVLYVTEPVEAIADEQARSLAQNADNVVVKTLDAPLEAYAQNEVVGGAGYFAVAEPEDASGASCSVGFSGWSPEGDPAIISAGHCTGDNSLGLSALTLPSAEPAGGGNPEGPVVLTEFLGNLAFSQYGGPGNSEGAEEDLNSVDISIWDVVNSDLELLPEVTDWTTADSDDLAASTTPVRSVGQATVGAEVSKSGRTTGFTSGTVEAVNGWAKVSGRWVYGFMNRVVSKEGDSGGAVIQGDRAVGILSGGGTDQQTGVQYMFAADLQNSLARTGGYTVALHLDAPVLTGPADGGEVYTGGSITGTGPASSTLEVTPDSGEPFDVAIDANGNWSFAAPGEVGPISYDVVATRGFDRSETTSFAFDVQLAPLAAPVITSPANGTSVETELTSITGTGEPGATIELTGAVEDVTEVSASGTWTVDAELSYGTYSVTAVQFRADDDEASPAAVSDFAVAPVAPVITAPENGTSFAHDAGPKTVTGTGIDGATLEVFVGDTSAGWVIVENGEWTLQLTSALAAGEHTITATQTINGATGAAAATTVTITAAAVAGTPGSSLASTGVSPVLPAAAALLVLLLGAGALVVARRRGLLGQRG